MERNLFLVTISTMNLGRPHPISKTCEAEAVETPVLGWHLFLRYVINISSYEVWEERTNPWICNTIYSELILRQSPDSCSCISGQPLGAGSSAYDTLNSSSVGSGSALIKTMDWTTKKEGQCTAQQHGQRTNILIYSRIGR